MQINAKEFSLPLDQILEKCPDLKQITVLGKIDLGDPKALYQYNKCLYKVLDDIDLELDFNKDKGSNLIPTAGLRRCIASTIIEIINPLKIIEIGTGASAIMALLFAKKNIEVIATEINNESVISAQKQIELNNLSQKITLKQSQGDILQYLEKYFPVDCILSLPPYYAEKTKLKVPKKRGFLGVESELYSFGEETDFSTKLIEEWIEMQKKFKKQTFLSILWKNQKSMEKVFLKFEKNDLSTQIIEILAGTRIRYLTISKYAKI
jgi:methylase of polypeptide subunit release factors